MKVLGFLQPNLPITKVYYHVLEQILSFSTHVHMAEKMSQQRLNNYEFIHVWPATLFQD